MMTWKPQLEDGGTAIYDRLADAIARDVEAGVLRPGERLPPHRELAHELGLGVGTVSKAYAEAERRGLLTGHVGRGSFVSGGARGFGPAGPVEGIVDLARNLPPAAPAAKRLAETLARMRAAADPQELVSYVPPEGPPRVRATAAEWLRRRHRIESADAEQIVQCNGGQQGLALAFGAICRPGDTILCEAATFFGMRTLAEHASYRLCGIAMDGEGLDPQALERAIAATGARILYTVPTLQNPTTRTMSDARRRKIAGIARRHDLFIVEDEAYRLYADDIPTSFADLAPERTFHVASISKTLCTGLRVAFLIVPPSRRERVLLGVRAIGYCPPALNGMLFAQWVADGAADAIADEIRAEVDARTGLAHDIFGEAMDSPGGPRSLHVWLPMPPLEAERAAGRALRAGVEITPPDAPLVAPGEISGLRLCLGAVPDRTTLERALLVVREAIHAEVAPQSRAVV